MTFNPLDYKICFEKPKRLTDVTSWHGHIPFAFAIIQMLRPKIFVELGTHKGDSYCAFCQAVDRLELNTKCYAIDTWEGDEHSGFYGSDILEELRLYHDPIYGSFSQLIQSTFDQTLDYFSDNSIDLLHIDGLHTYDAVKHDFENWLLKMSSRGVILLHDINVREKEFGVWKLWEELKDKYPSFEFRHGHGLGMLIIGKNISKDIYDFLDIGMQDISISKFFSELGNKITADTKLESVKQKDTEIEELKRDIKTKNDKIIVLDEDIKSKNDKIIVLDEDIKSKNDKIICLEKDINSSYSKIEKLDNDIKSKNDKIICLEKDINSANNKIEQLNDDIKSKNDKIIDLSNSLTDMRSSIVWSSLTKYQKMIDIISPHGTMRRTIYDSMLRHCRKAVRKEKDNKKKLAKNVKFNIETRLSDILYLENVNRFLIEGWIFGTSRIKNLYVSIGDNHYYAKDIEIFRPDILDQYGDNVLSLFSGFSVPIIINPVSISKHFHVFLNAEFKNGDKFIYNIGDLQIRPPKNKTVKFDLPKNIVKDELLVICMATYNPKTLRFKRQIESIISQDYENWICIVCDDNSNDNLKRMMKDTIGNDDRFFFIENKDNVGFYYNFERCLKMVPSYAKYVALADQDDYWYPNKLSDCLLKLYGKTQLVYCDMRIIYENGDIISNTYWKNRKNYYKETDLLVIANTVTGAASIFSSDLLKKILPFPPRYGNVFHDQWIATVASASGGIEYIDKPLYDYIQDNENVIGHSDFGRSSIISIVKSYWKNTHKFNFLTRMKLFTNHIFVKIKYLYEFNYVYGKHIITIAETALVRDLNMDDVIRRPLSIIGLLKMHIKIVWRKETTDNIELKSLLSMLISRLYSLFIPFVYMRVKKHKDEDFIRNYSDQGIVEFKRKFSGRTFEPTQDKQYINCLLSRLDPVNFFGGYIAMFNVAKMFAHMGYNVRIILTDQKEIIDADLEKVRNHDPELKSFLTQVEYLTWYSENNIIQGSKNDIFIATSWWTAHIANEVIKKTKFSKFIYLIQDYEPIFYEHGTYRILAEQSYKFDFFPIFSTDILQKYFIECGIVNYENSGVFIKNPVLKFDLEKQQFLEKEGKKKLLFYARPQPHNSRNLYPLGCLALDVAREMGFFKENDWEIIAIGGDIGDQILPSGLKIKHIGKFDIGKYKDILPTHDLGFALMDSPHPSLLPIEMAAAGLLVVTNTYGLKNQEYFSKISQNITAVEPNIESLTNALVELSKQVDNFSRRMKGSNVNWPHDWKDVLPRVIIEKAIESIIN